MDLIHAGLLLLLLCSAYGYRFRSEAGHGLFLRDPKREWERMETIIGEEMTEALAPANKFLKSASSSGSSTPEAKKVPEYVVVSGSEDWKQVFKPEKGARPLPSWVKDMLLKTSSSSSASGTTPTRQKLVEILCHVDRMYVRIRRELFKTSKAYKYLKLGSCPVNQATNEHYYLLYLLKTDCAFKKESNRDYWVVKNTLRYMPASPVLREMPFDLPLQCNYPRYFHSYKVGFYPKLQGGTVFKALQPKSSFTLTPLDASGNEITGSKTYTLGQTMHFEAKQPDSSANSGNMRMYIDVCFMTASRDPSSSPKYTVIDNQGCMVDGKVTKQSKFIRCTSKMTQKFSVAALIFKEMVSSLSSPKQLYMHCRVSMGSLTPTPSSKACNYDPDTKKWTELYGPDSVCTCCESTCSSARTKASSNMISSHSWKVDLSNKDGFDKVDPRMTFSDDDDDTFTSEDLDMEEHREFLTWDHHY